MATKKIYGAEGRGDLLLFDPAKLCVHCDPDHPQYDPRVELPVSEGLVESIMSMGVLEPLIISRDGEDVYVVDGRQRRAAAIEANKRLKKERRDEVQVPCVWRRGDDATLFEVSIAANEIRQGDSAVMRARKMQRLTDLGRSADQLAVVFGCSSQTVKSHLALLECAKEVQSAVESGKVPATVATKLAKLPREEQRTTLAKMLNEGATKGAKAKAVVQHARGEKVVQLLSRKLLERWKAELEAASMREADVDDPALNAAYAVLNCVLGEADAILPGPGVFERISLALQRARGEAPPPTLSETLAGSDRLEAAQEA